MITRVDKEYLTASFLLFGIESRCGQHMSHLHLIKADATQWLFTLVFSIERCSQIKDCNLMDENLESHIERQRKRLLVVYLAHARYLQQAPASSNLRRS